jgi:hypothetical protein
MIHHGGILVSVRPSSPYSNQSEFVSTLPALLESRRLSSLRSPNHSSPGPSLLRRRLPPLVTIEDEMWQRPKALTLASTIFNVPSAFASTQETLRAHSRKSVFLAIFPGLAKPKSVTLLYIYLTTTKYIVFKLERIR